MAEEEMVVDRCDPALEAVVDLAANRADAVPEAEAKVGDVKTDPTVVVEVIAGGVVGAVRALILGSDLTLAKDLILVLVPLRVKDFEKLLLVVLPQKVL
jgi:hypothetical protein